MQAEEEGREARPGAQPAPSLGKYGNGANAVGWWEQSQDLTKLSCLPAHIAVTASITYLEGRKGNTGRAEVSVCTVARSGGAISFQSTRPPLIPCCILAGPFCCPAATVESNRKCGVCGIGICPAKPRGLVPKRSLGEKYATHSFVSGLHFSLPVVVWIGYVHHYWFLPWATVNCC